MAKVADFLWAMIAACVIATSGGAIASSAPLGSASSGGAPVIYMKLFHAAMRASQAARHIVSFVTTDADVKVDRLYPVAADRAGDAIVALAGLPGGQGLLSQINAVRLEQGLSSDVTVDGHALVITVNPAMGVAGCPSVADIERSLWKSISKHDTAVRA
jgi:hypothetical protein